MVDDFLKDNQRYLDDSELPSDSEDNEEGEEEASSHQSSAIKQTISEPKSTANSQEEYPLNEINRIIKEAKQNNEFLNYLNDNKQYIVPSNHSSSNNDQEISSDGDESSISDKYLNHYDQSKHSITTSYLADEFLQDSNTKSHKSSYLEDSALGSSQNNTSQKKSYLKPSILNQQQPSFQGQQLSS